MIKFCLKTNTKLKKKKKKKKKLALNPFRYIMSPGILGIICGIFKALKYSKV